MFLNPWRRRTPPARQARGPCPQYTTSGSLFFERTSSRRVPTFQNGMCTAPGTCPRLNSQSDRTSRIAGACPSSMSARSSGDVMVLFLFTKRINRTDLPERVVDRFLGNRDAAVGHRVAGRDHRLRKTQDDAVDFLHPLIVRLVLADLDSARPG